MTTSTLFAPTEETLLANTPTAAAVVKKALKLNKFKNLVAGVISNSLYIVPAVVVTQIFAKNTSVFTGDNLLPSLMVMTLLAGAAIQLSDSILGNKNIFNSTYWKDKFNTKLHKEWLVEQKKIIATLRYFKNANDYTDKDYRLIAAAYVSEQLIQPETQEWLNNLKTDESRGTIGGLSTVADFSQLMLDKNYESIIKTLDPEKFQKAVAEQLKIANEENPLHLNLLAFKNAKKVDIKDIQFFKESQEIKPNPDEARYYLYRSGVIHSTDAQLAKSKFILSASDVYSKLKDTDYQDIEKIVLSDDIKGLGTVMKLLTQVPKAVNWDTMKELVSKNDRIDGLLLTQVLKDIDTAKTKTLTSSATPDNTTNKLASKIARSQQKDNVDQETGLKNR